MENKKTQWISYGLEQGGYGNKYHITEELTEKEFLKKYGICVSIVSYYPIKNIPFKQVSTKQKFAFQKESILYNLYSDKNSNLMLILEVDTIKNIAKYKKYGILSDETYTIRLDEVQNKWFFKTKVNIVK